MRISATSFDNFQRYLDDLMTKGELIQRISSPFEPTYEMQVGTAIHSFIEKPVYDFAGIYEINGFQFKDLDILLKNLEGYLDGFQEMKFRTEVGDVNLITKLDLLLGNTVVEHKTTFGVFNVEKYVKSWQWKLYLYATQSDIFIYNIIGLNKDKDVIGIKFNEMFTCYKYEKLESDCENIIKDFRAFILDNNLEIYFQDK